MILVLCSSLSRELRLFIFLDGPLEDETVGARVVDCVDIDSSSIILVPSSLGGGEFERRLCNNEWLVITIDRGRIMSNIISNLIFEPLRFICLDVLVAVVAVSSSVIGMLASLYAELFWRRGRSPERPASQCHNVTMASTPPDFYLYYFPVTRHFQGAQ